MFTQPENLTLNEGECSALFKLYHLGYDMVTQKNSWSLQFENQIDNSGHSMLTD